MNLVTILTSLLRAENSIRDILSIRMVDEQTQNELYLEILKP